MPTRRAFTIIEIILVMGIIGTLASIVIAAVNPSLQLASAQDAKRQTAVRELQNAVTQYQIDNGALPDDGVPLGASAENALPICKHQATITAGCLDFSPLVDQSYITAIPQDPSEGTLNLSGFTMYQDEDGRPLVNATHIGVSASSIVARSAEPRRAYRFDGSDDYIAISNNAALQPLTGNWSVAFWIYRLGNGAGDYPQIIGSRPWSAAADKGWAVSVGGSAATGKMAVHFADGSTGFDVTAVQSTSVNTTNQWEHWAVVFDKTAGQVRFYKDGALDATVTPTFPSGSINQTDAMNIGREVSGSNSRRLNARLFDLRVYNAALTDSDVETVGNFESIAASPIYWLQGDDTHPSVAYDASGNGLIGTKTNITASTFHHQGCDVPYSFQNTVGFSSTVRTRNSNFAGSAANWSLTAGTVYGSNTLVSTNVTAYNDLFSQNVEVVAGYKYKLTMVVDSLTAGHISPRIGSSGSASANFYANEDLTGGGDITSAGTYTRYIQFVSGQPLTLAARSQNGAAPLTATISQVKLEAMQDDDSGFIPRNESAPNTDIFGNPLEFNGAVTDGC